jgi:YVTN family beta-propeller protein
VAKDGGNTVSVIATASHAVVATIPVGNATCAVALFVPPTPQSQINQVICAVQAPVTH